LIAHELTHVVQQRAEGGKTKGNGENGDTVQGLDGSKEKKTGPAVQRTIKGVREEEKWTLIDEILDRSGLEENDEGGGTPRETVIGFVSKKFSEEEENTRKSVIDAAIALLEASSSSSSASPRTQIGGERGEVAAYPASSSSSSASQSTKKKGGAKGTAAASPAKSTSSSASPSPKKKGGAGGGGKDLAMEYKMNQIGPYMALLPHMRGELGEIVKGKKGEMRQTVTGGHVYLAMLEKWTKKRLEVIPVGEDNETKVWVCGWRVNGGVYKKSTMFPKDWSEADIQASFMSGNRIDRGWECKHKGLTVLIEKVGSTMYPVLPSSLEKWREEDIDKFLMGQQEESKEGGGAGVRVGAGGRK
jgi:hypothetical protein